MVHTIFLPRNTVHRVPGLWMSLVGFIPQEDRRPCLIYYYMWSGLNAEVLRKAL